MLTGISVFFVYFNNRSFRPFRRLALRYGSRGGMEESEYISNVLSGYEALNDQMSRELDRWRDVKLDVALNYLLHGEQDSHSELARLVEGYYTSFRVLCVAAQDDEGRCDLSAFSALDDYLSSRAIMYSGNVRVFLLDSAVGGQDIRDALRRCFALEERMFIFAGVSDLYADMGQLGAALRQARERMAALPALEGESIPVALEDARASDSPGITLMAQNHLVDQVLGGRISYELIDEALLRDPLAPLQSMCANAHVLSVLLRTICLSAHRDFPAALDSPAFTSGVNAFYLAATLKEGFGAVAEQYAPGQTDLSEQVKKYVNARFREPLTLESIAEAFSLSPTYLSRYFKKATGINLFVYLSRVRMEAAKAILVEHPDLKISEVAEAVGITSSDTFHRQFKNYTGMAPDQYRRHAMAGKELST